MIILLSLLYISIGAFVTFELYRLYQKSLGRREDNAAYCVVMGLLWPIAAPFAFALYFAKYGYSNYTRRK